MSKTSKRKSGGESSKNKSLSVKDSHKRPSVFERLGTKASTISIGSLSVNVSNQLEFCRAWAQNGTCPFGKSCKLSYSHTLISPSKRSVKKEDLEKRVQNNLVRRGSPSEAGVDWESWDQSELEYQDEKALERRRQLLQRELELQMKKETQKQEANKHRSSSTSSDSSSSSSSTTSSGSSTDSSVSTKKKIEPKIQSPSLLERSIIIKKTMGKGIHKESPPRKSSTSKKLSPPRKLSRRKSLSPVRKQLSPPPKSKAAPPTRSSERGGRRNDSPVAVRGRSPDRKTSRSSGSSRRSPRPSSQRERRGRSPRPRPPSRNRTPERRKDDDRRGKDDGRRSDRKSDFRDKREAAREKERVEALERCRERQREREALAKEREKERKERDKRRRGGYNSSTSSRRSPQREEKRHERKSERDRSYSRERVRDRALERVMERRGSSRERSYERPYAQNSPSYRGGGGTERNRYGSERVSSDRGSTREERRGARRWVESREKQSGSREWSEHTDWENRSRCEERTDEWCGYTGPGNGNEWRARSHLSHHDDRRSHHPEKEKDHPAEIPKEPKEPKDLNVPLHSKRSGDDLEMDLGKRARLEEVALQEELSDISDDPDDILDREDEVFTDRDIVPEEGGEGSLLDGGPQPNPPEDSSRLLSPSLSQRVTEPRIEDDPIDSLDFEEISDEELEEELKSNKGVSVVDALGVDWASLVAEWRPPRETAKKGSARANWSSEAVFRRIGISSDLAGEQLLGRITKTYLSDEKNTSETKSSCLPSTLLQNKRALSARTDIIIRRQLCGLPVISSETHPTTGLCQWAV